MLKRCWLIVLCLAFASQVAGEDISPKDTVFLEYSTLINYNGSSVGTVFVEVKHGALKYSVPLQDDGEGEWSGAIYLPDSLPGGVPTGSWNRKYFWAYAGDTTKEDETFGVRDTSELQGSASGLTVGDIIDSLIAIGYFGSGTGSYKDTIIVLDEDTNTVEGVSITVRNASGTVVAAQESDVNGVRIFNLDPTVYTFSLQRIGVIVSDDTTITVSGNQTDTIWVMSFSPSAPPTDSVCIVYGWVKRSGVGVGGARVKMWLPQFPVTYHGVIVDAINPMTVTTDNTGYFEFDEGWYPNSLLLPANTRYIFRVEWQGLKFEKKIEVPLQDSWQIELDLP